MISSNKGFTITELMVIIVIVGIVSAISYIGYQDYTIDSRDTIRKSDMANLKASLKTFKQKSGQVPVPSDNFQIVNSGSANVQVLQGKIDNDIAINNMTSIPKDPKNGASYLYSTPLNKQEFQIALTLENNGSPRALLDGDYKVVAKNMFPSLILAVTGVGQIEIATGAITAGSSGSINRQYFIINGGRYNLPYDFINGNPVANGITIGFDELISEKGTNLGIASDYPNCNAIYEAGKFLGAGEYQIIDSNGILYDTNCDISTFSIYPTSIPYGGTGTISDTCRIHPTSYASSNTGIVQISGTGIITGFGGLTGQVNITPVGGNCVNNDPKVLTVTPTGFTVNTGSLYLGQTGTISHNCINSPTFGTSTPDIILVSGTGITTNWIGTGTVTLESGICSDSTPKNIDILKPEGCGPSFGQTVGYGLVTNTGTLCNSGLTAGPFSGKGGTPVSNGKAFLSWTCSNGALCKAPYGRIGSCDTYDYFVSSAADPSSIQQSVWGMCDIGSDNSNIHGPLMDSGSALVACQGDYSLPPSNLSRIRPCADDVDIILGGNQDYWTNEIGPETSNIFYCETLFQWLRIGNKVSTTSNYVRCLRN